MTGTYSTSLNENAWEIVPANAFLEILLPILFFYLVFRHFVVMLILGDIIFAWLRRYNWLPEKGNRRKAVIHWIIALGLFFGFLYVGGSMGWLKYVPQ